MTRSVRGIILEQARLSRERAMFYRKLARTLCGSRSVPELERCARDLDERAVAMEDYASKGAPLKEVRRAQTACACGGAQADERHSVDDLHIALELAFAAGIANKDRGSP